MTADTQEQAERQFRARAIWRLGRDRGVYAPLPSSEEAALAPVSEAEAAKIERMRRTALYGTPDVVASRLRALASELGVDEIAVLTTLHDKAARRRSYELLAAEFGLATQREALAAE